eukprot:scaffold117050_cov17-Tisochrysis_lutea.AAC.1
MMGGEVAFRIISLMIFVAFQTCSKVLLEIDCSSRFSIHAFRLLWNKLDHPSGSEKRMRLVDLIKGSIRDKKASIPSVIRRTPQDVTACGRRHPGSADSLTLAICLWLRNEDRRIGGRKCRRIAAHGMEYDVELKSRNVSTSSAEGIWEDRTGNSAKNDEVERKVAMEVLDVECMQAAGLVTDIELWRRKEVRFNTRMLYTVNKLDANTDVSHAYFLPSCGFECLNMSGYRRQLHQHIGTDTSSQTAHFGLLETEPPRSRLAPALPCVQ